jgi:hypothetical protein
MLGSQDQLFQCRFFEAPTITTIEKPNDAMDIVVRMAVVLQKNNVETARYFKLSGDQGNSNSQ